MRKILVVYGTRPEAIKMAPVVEALRRHPEELEVAVCTTGQHREMLDQVQDLFGFEADLDLDLMRPNQSLNALAARAFKALDRVLEKQAPEWVLVQGDTTTAMVTAMAAFHRGVRVGHVEAGLRTGDLGRPFPEEANRRFIDVLADALFAPTRHAWLRLRAEGVAEEKLFLTGNTVVDALMRVARIVGDVRSADQVLVTVHRRESFGVPLREIFAALRELATAFPATRWVYPVHRNPNVAKPARELLADLPNLDLHDPFDYLELVRQLRASRLVLTDSGGIQEEAPVFGKPVLVLRETTERPEGVAAGVAKLVGVSRQRIVAETRRLLTDPDSYERMARAVNPYGDGRAAERIATILCGRQVEPFQADDATWTWTGELAARP
jgi:UDP-N-acetylglucosamine 2-epimerase (non-hydrolysing)